VSSILTLDGNTDAVAPPAVAPSVVVVAVVGLGREKKANPLAAAAVWEMEFGSGESQ
jgi:hypothetical protein